jgi:transcriptional regulator with XRE-family HTH domain
MSTSQIPETLGRRLAHLRERRGWTQKELADRAEISVTFLSEVENDHRNIGSATLLKVADALGASLDYLMRGETERTPARQPVVIPPELSQAAEDKGWSYGQTVVLLETQRTVLARRSGGTGARASNTWTTEDWIDFHRRLFGGA